MFLFAQWLRASRGERESAHDGVATVYTWPRSSTIVDLGLLKYRVGVLLQATSRSFRCTGLRFHIQDTRCTHQGYTIVSRPSFCVNHAKKKKKKFPGFIGHQAATNNKWRTPRRHHHNVYIQTTINPRLFHLSYSPSRDA